MAIWTKQRLPRENGELVDMQVPIIVSASRSTDILAFYADGSFTVLIRLAILHGQTLLMG